MELYVNDLSIAGQFPDTATFATSIDHLMQMRQTARRFGRELHCHRNFVNTQVTSNHNLQQVIQTFSRNQQQAIMQWITQYGPFWDENRLHSPSDYLECADEVVTESAVGAAGACCYQGLDRRLISLVPSKWEFTPIPVFWVHDDDARTQIDICNYWQHDQLENDLSNAPIHVQSWEQLKTVCTKRCPNLTFAPNCFDPLQGQPFVQGAAERIQVLLDTLEVFRTCVDEQGQRTAKGNQIISDHFAGGKAWFTDSSGTEKHEFKQRLTFPHPGRPDEKIFCTWHGKIKTPQFRIHFSDPFSMDQPLYIVYVGAKITKS